MQHLYHNPHRVPWPVSSPERLRTVARTVFRTALIAAMLALVVAPDLVFAASGGCSSSATDPFCGSTGVYQTLKSWSQGGLGLFLSLLSLVVGLTGAVRIGSLFPVVIGIAFAISFSQGPTILETVMGATLIG